MRKYKIEKSLYPDDKNIYLVVRYSETKGGLSIGRVFKGTYKECLEYKDKRLNEEI